jgi:hypothetical protein
MRVFHHNGIGRGSVRGAEVSSKLCGSPGENCEEETMVVRGLARGLSTSLAHLKSRFTVIWGYTGAMSPQLSPCSGLG